MDLGLGLHHSWLVAVAHGDAEASILSAWNLVGVLRLGVVRLLPVIRQEAAAHLLLTHLRETFLKRVFVIVDLLKNHDLTLPRLGRHFSRLLGGALAVNLKRLLL